MSDDGWGEDGDQGWEGDESTPAPSGSASKNRKNCH